MIFGDEERFAVVVKDVERMPFSVAGEYEMGAITFRVQGKRAGNDVNEMISLGHWAMRQFLEGQAQGAKLNLHADCQTLFEDIRSAFYFSDDTENPNFDRDDEDAWNSSTTKARQYAPLILTADSNPFFDGWHMFVVRSGEECRVIFTNTYNRNEHPKVLCASLKWEEIESALKAFCDWYEAYEAQSLKPPPQEPKNKRK